MKVAMVTPYWFPVRGGVTTYVSDLAAELRTQGHEVLVIAREGAAPGATTIPGTAREFARGAAAELASFRPDAVHAHGHWYTLAAGLRHRRRDPACAVVFTIHTPFPPRPRWRELAFSLLMSRADFVTGVSAELLGQVLRKHRPRTRTRVTRAGISVRPTNAEDTRGFLRMFGLEGRSPLIGYLGRLAWEGKVRGVEQLIRAMRIVGQGVPSAVLMIGGDGPHRARLEALARTEAPYHVVFLGDVPDPAPRFFTAAEVYAHISHHEGLPIALLEAMAYKSAIVASRVGGIPEVIHDGVNGLLVVNDPDEIADRILRVLGSPELRSRLTQRAIEDVTTHFGWPHAAARFVTLYGGPTRKRVVFTVDLEKDYHSPTPSFRGVETALPKLFDLFDRHGIRATVFATSDLGESHADALRMVLRRGHALGCHGESHDVEYLCGRPYVWQRESLARATHALETVTGVRPNAFRAPNFSVDGSTIRVLEELGYAVDSSVLPGRRVGRIRRRLDFLFAPRDPYRPARDNPALPGEAAVWEVPVTENPLALGGPIGLGYVNAFGVQRALEAVARAPAYPVVFLIHPWELVDPPPGRIPPWMRTGCTSDPTKLDAFLGRLRAEHEVTTLEAVLA